jgi:hypothetical protein
MSVSKEIIQNKIDGILSAIIDIREKIAQCENIERKTAKQKQQLYVDLTEKRGERRALKSLLGEENSDDNLLDKET